MKHYYQNTQVVLKQIKQEGISDNTIEKYKRCFAELEAYLVSNNRRFTDSNLKEWLSRIQFKYSNNILNVFKGAINRLRRVYDPETYLLYSAKLIGLQKLNQEFTEIIRDIITNLNKSEQTCDRYRFTLNSIFGELYKNGLTKANLVKYTDLIHLINVSDCLNYYAKTSYHEVLRYLILYLHSKYNLPYGFALFARILGFHRGLYWNRVSLKDIEMLKTDTERKISLPEYLEIQNKLILEHKKYDYSLSRVIGIERICNVFYMFLEVNHLSYWPKAGQIWAESLKQTLKNTEYLSHKRIILLIEQAYYGKKWNLALFFNNRKKKLNDLPYWCRNECEKFIILKKKEGKGSSALSMYASSLYRFCEYLVRTGLNSFKSITPSVIKGFNLQDIHGTPAGKNAYNSRIRLFLQYLSENKLIDNPYIFMALPHDCAPKERIITILTSEEQRLLKKLFKENNSNISLRQKAILQLGLQMGIRGCDITGLTIQNVDWEQQTLNLIQSKTGYEIKLPMPSEVTNAIFNYILKERHISKNEKIFIASKAPYQSLNRIVCIKALQKALPKRKVKGSGFHVTRKTFATNMLRKGINPHKIAEILGHRNISTVSRYLSVDNEGMKHVGLSLRQLGIMLQKEM